MKVWKREMELGADVSLKQMQDEIENGITEGMDAFELSRHLRDYLNYPKLLFHRVQSERGPLTIFKNAAVFHPGTGVYRSSYMNTWRFVATETNMAYHSADHERWKNLDFVVGIEIGTSNNHKVFNSKGEKDDIKDICDELTGRYPKDFKFVGWHPHCRCIATTILKTEAEIAKDTERILNGEEPLPPKYSANYIENVPEKFSRWVLKNTKRIEVARKKGSLPYFLADNEKYVNEAIPATLRHLYETMAKYQYTDPNLKAKEARINAKMKELFDNNDFGLEIKHEYLKDVIEGGFKNMFELGRDHSYSRPDSNFGQIDADSERLVISHRMYGPFGRTGLSLPTDQEQKYTGNQLPRSGYEKYGHVLDRDKTKSYSVNGATKYGDVQVRFKKDMVNCTWTFGDSLKANGAYYQPSLTSDPHIESFDRLYKGSADDLLDNTNWDSLTDWILKTETRYIELQYHGLLTIDCVESMIFPSDPKALIGEELVKKLMGKGAELWYMKDGKVIQYRP